jgi:hypothetical protein
MEWSTLTLVLSMEDDEGGRDSAAPMATSLLSLWFLSQTGTPLTKEQHCGLWNGRVYRGVYAGKEGAASVDDDADETLPSCGDIRFCVEEDDEPCGSDGKDWQSDNVVSLWMRIELELFVDGGVEFSEWNVAGAVLCNVFLKRWRWMTSLLIVSVVAAVTFVDVGGWRYRCLQRRWARWERKKGANNWHLLWQGVTHVLMPSPANLFLRRLLSVSTRFASGSPVSIIVGDTQNGETSKEAVQSSYGQLEFRLLLSNRHSFINLVPRCYRTQKNCWGISWVNKQWYKQESASYNIWCNSYRQGVGWHSHPASKPFVTVGAFPWRTLPLSRWVLSLCYGSGS